MTYIVSSGALNSTHSLTHSLDLSKCVGQGYDGASNLSSATVGAASEFQKDASLTTYDHCMMHTFNLCASQSVNVTYVRNCLDKVRDILSFLTPVPNDICLIQLFFSLLTQTQYHLHSKSCALLVSLKDATPLLQHWIFYLCCAVPYQSGRADA